MNKFKVRFNDRTNVDLSSKYLYLKKTNKLKDYEDLVEKNLALIDSLVANDKFIGTSIFQMLNK